MPMQVDVKVNVADYGPITAMAVVKMNRMIRERGNNNISSAGANFTKHFGCRTKTKKKGTGYETDVFIKPGYGKVFEFGSTSVGRAGAGGMLWIGVGSAKHIRAKTFRKHGNKMFRPAGSNVLVSRSDGKIKYIGIKSVSVGPRLSIRKISAEEGRKFGLYMAQARSTTGTV